MSRTIFFLVALSTAACTTMGHYRELCKSYVGQPLSQVILKWGLPTHTEPKGDLKAVEFDYLDSRNTADYMVPATDGEKTAHVECKTVFFVNNENMVKGFRFKGKGCAAN